MSIPIMDREVVTRSFPWLIVVRLEGRESRASICNRVAVGHPDNAVKHPTTGILRSRRTSHPCDLDVSKSERETVATKPI